MINNNKTKELNMYVEKNASMRRVSTWIFLLNLGFCFRTNGYNWKNLDYKRGVKMCKRVMNAAKSDNTIQLRGTMIDELEKEDRVDKLFSGEKIVLR